ncbi:MAG: lytic murein transglycosylase [Candidatus Moranbacteria bacterium]|nr:lytic murein transglycosylase [Candidatus Moranbacteria bacterium]
MAIFFLAASFLLVAASGAQAEVKVESVKLQNILLTQNVDNIFTISEAPAADPLEVEKAADFASQATGVRKDFIMGLLVVESDLGRNSGKCTYQEVEDGANIDHQKGRLSTQAWNTFNERREIIKDIAKDLGYDYEKLSVSCNPGSAYAGTGGAMGIPQFMPDTWMEYKDRISAIVGKENPDPWDEKDAAVAVALKLSDVSGVTEHNIYAERNAAKMYLSGNTSSRYDWYANQIMYWSKNYAKLLV